MSNKILFISLILAGFILISCTRKGCADPLANNYDKNIVKLDTSKCLYGDEAIEDEPPCGTDIEFCADYGSENIFGNISVTEPQEGKLLLKWDSDLDEDTIYSTLEITIYGAEKGEFTLASSQDSGSFEAFYYNDTIGIVNATSGQLNISTYSVANGITGTFEMKLENEVDLKKGNLYQVK
jgi:hypothetical protein